MNPKWNFKPHDISPWKSSGNINIKTNGVIGQSSWNDSLAWSQSFENNEELGMVDFDALYWRKAKPVKKKKKKTRKNVIKLKPRQVVDITNHDLSDIQEHAPDVETNSDVDSPNMFSSSAQTEPLNTLVTDTSPERRPAPEVTVSAEQGWDVMISILT